jgi:glutathione synthase/RimK-type ligase-like ATP-grasp enzyme
VILLWGLPGDDPLDAVADALTRRGVAFTLLDQRRALDQRIELEIGCALAGAVWCGTERIALAEVRALYTRVYDARKLPPIAAAGPGAYAAVQALEAALWSWADDTAARVVNRPTAMASNGSKPYQAAIIANAGFFIPETLITTDPEAAAAFWDRHGEVIYKSVSGVRSQVSRLRAEHRERLADVASCPTQFQAWVPGRDHRVHVIGDEVFAAEVISDADDYRYASAGGHGCELHAVPLPAAVAERARALAAALDLPVAGIDLRRTPDGRWYCFEVNSSPCFTYYEHHTGQPIAAALAAYLAAAHQ